MSYPQKKNKQVTQIFEMYQFFQFKWSIFSHTGVEESGKNAKSGFFTGLEAHFEDMVTI